MRDYRRYTKSLDFYSNFCNSADCRKHLKCVENNMMSKDLSVFCSAKTTVIQVGQNWLCWDPGQ